MDQKGFLPEEYLEQRVQRRSNIVVLTLFLIVMGSVASAFYVTDRQRFEVKKLQAQVSTQFEEAAKRLDQLDQLQQQKKAMMQKAKITASLLERVPRSNILAEMINNMPATVGLLEFDLTTKVKAAPRAAGDTAMQRARDKRAADAQEAKDEVPVVPETEISINLIGLAPTDVELAQFMAALDRCEMFKDVQLLYSEGQQVEDQVMRQFRIEMMLNQDLDMRKYEPKRVSRHLAQNPLGDAFQINADGQMQYPDHQIPVSDRPTPAGRE